MMSMTQLKMPGLRRALAGMAVLALSGCGAYPPVRPPQAPPEGSVQGAQGTAAQGDHAKAAAQYETMAATPPPPAQVDLLLAAVRKWLAAGRAADATRVLTSLNEVGLTPAQRTERSLLSAESSLAAQHPQEAWQKIAALPEPTTAGGAVRFFSLKMRIAMATARPVDAVIAEIAAERFAHSCSPYFVPPVTAASSSILKPATTRRCAAGSSSVRSRRRRAARRRRPNRMPHAGAPNIRTTRRSRCCRRPCRVR